ncbi:MAG: GHKL domain-containing protein [Desulfobacteraceae bacterium]|nr:GHKL domain-containing protein [Desulfobacteraceae bacterium]
MISELESIAYLEELLSAIRHKFGNTVNSLQITLGVLADDFSCNSNEKFKAHIDQIAQIVDQQHIILRALKHYTIFDGREISNIFFPELWRIFIDAAEEKLAAKNITLVDQSLPPPCKIEGNANAIHKVLVSILDNAVDALKNCEEPVVTITTEQNTHALIIGLSDNGEGIADKDSTKMFTPLFSSRRNRSGMGLAISRMLLHQMGGELTISPNPNGGTVATINLKYERSNTTITN